jgi:hypothetical protein
MYDNRIAEHGHDVKNKLLARVEQVYIDRIKTALGGSSARKD